MVYKVELKAVVLIWDENEKRYNKNSTSIDFKINKGYQVADFVETLVMFADDPLELTISREDE